MSQSMKTPTKVPQWDICPSRHPVGIRKLFLHLLHKQTMSILTVKVEGLCVFLWICNPLKQRTFGCTAAFKRGANASAMERSSTSRSDLAAPQVEIQSVSHQLLAHWAHVKLKITLKTFQVRLKTVWPKSADTEGPFTQNASRWLEWFHITICSTKQLLNSEAAHINQSGCND